MAYMRRDKKRWGSCVLGWISVMVSGRSFFWKECKMRHGKTWGKIHQDVIDWTCFVVDVEMWEELVDVLIPPWIAADGSQLSGHLSGWRDHPSFSTSYFTKSGQLRVRGDWLFCFERSDPGGQTLKKGWVLGWEDTSSQKVNRGSSPLLETKVGILAEWPKKAGFEF